MTDHDGLEREDQLTTFGPAEHEKVLGESSEAVRLVRDVRQALGHVLGVHRSESFAQDAAHAVDRRDRRSQLVADHADEGVAEGIGPLLGGVPDPEVLRSLSQASCKLLGLRALRLESPGRSQQVRLPA